MSDFAIEASRAVEPYFYYAPVPSELPEGYTVSQYQFAAAEYAVSRDNCLIADEPGLGKTCEALLVDNAQPVRSPSVVVCPASLRLNWEREIWLWSTRENVSTYPVLKASDGISTEADFNIVSYHLLHNPDILAALMDLDPDHLIFDEFHKAKDPKGNRTTKSICGYVDPSTKQEHDGLGDLDARITALTGTPSPNQPREMYNMIRLLDWEAINCASLDSFNEFYYAKGGGMIRGPVFDAERQVWTNKVHWSENVRNQPQNLAHFQDMCRGNFMVRRLTEQCLHELPEKRWHFVPLELNPKIRRVMKSEAWQQAARLYELNPNVFDTSIPIDGEISTMRRELGEACAPAVGDYIEDLLLGGVEKLVVGAWHHSVLEVLRERLSKYGLVYMDGRTSTKKKQAAVDAFQQREDVRIILGQTQPLSEGWTLTRAQDAVLAEFDWVPGNNDQFLRRCWRRGQTGTHVIGHVPFVPDSLHERIMGNAIGKAVNIHEALDA